jgi:predicted flap endonuclease-1-like 5' DNA nuclease
MANLKKEVMSLMSRFDAAQEAFLANSVELKKVTKKHKKELKAARAEAKAARIEIEALKAELAIVKAGGPAKRSAGRPKKAVTAAAAKPAAKRGPGRPKKTAAATAKAEAPAKKAAVKKAPVKSASTGAKKGPGRPRTKPAAPASALQSIKGVGPAMAAQFEAAGVKTPAAMAKLSNVKMAVILAKCGPRYRNADSAKMQSYRDAAKAAK